jgi:hypothetical protein
MSDVDPGYAAFLEREYAKEAARAQKVLMANQLAQFKTGSSATQRAAAPKADQYLKLPERELPSTAPELRQELKESIASYHKAIEHAQSFEAKLREARKAEVDALTDDATDEKKVVKTVAENLGLQQVYSRRAELAKQKVPEAFVAILPIAKALAQELTNRCYALAAERVARHRAVFRPRLDLESFHRTFSNSLYSFPVDFASDLDRLIECCLTLSPLEVVSPT